MIDGWAGHGQMSYVLFKHSRTRSPSVVDILEIFYKKKSLQQNCMGTRSDMTCMGPPEVHQIITLKMMYPYGTMNESKEIKPVYDSWNMKLSNEHGKNCTFVARLPWKHGRQIRRISTIAACHEKHSHLEITQTAVFKEQTCKDDMTRVLSSVWERGRQFCGDRE